MKIYQKNWIEVKTILLIKQLKSLSYLGVKVELAPNPEIIRDLIVGDYTVRNLIGSKEINILRIWHHKEEKNRLPVK